MTTTAIQSFITSARARRSPAMHLNREGAPSFRRSLKEQVNQVLLTGTLKDTFYVEGGELGLEAMAVLREAMEQMPEYLARAVVYARQKGFMRLLPTLGLAILSGGRARTKELFESAFDQVIAIPDDARSFAELCLSGVIPGRKGLGGVTRDMVRQYLMGLSEYHALKYGSSASMGVTLRDLIRLTHPRPDSQALSERFGWLVNGASALGSNPELNPQIRAFEALKTATDENEIVALIRQGRLPFEVVLPTLKGKSTTRIWTELLYQAPYRNLLSNLVTFTRHGVFKSEECVRYAVEKLTNPRAVQHSKVLPFRFFTAWKKYSEGEGADSRIADALRVALELSFSNLPSFGGLVVTIGTDVSGSMSEEPGAFGRGLMFPWRGDLLPIDIAGIFTGALLRQVKNRVIVLPFNGHIVQGVNLSSRDDILVTAGKIASLGGGSTAVGAPIEHLLRSRTHTDVFVGITDSEDWAYGQGHSCSGSFLTLWRRYRAEVNPAAQAFLVTVAPYRDAVAPGSEPGVHYIYGWSAEVLKYIVSTIEGGLGQVQEIERMVLGKHNTEGVSVGGGESEEDEG